MKKSKYKVYVYEAYTKITRKRKGQILPKKTKIEEFRIEEVVIE